MIEHQHHDVDDEGNPAGGRTKGTGFDFEWNSGPPDKPNGATLEDVLEAAIGRLQFLQKTQPNRDKAIALNHLETAWLWFLKNQTETKHARLRLQEAKQR